MVTISTNALYSTSDELSNAILMGIDSEEKLTILVLEGSSDWIFWSRMCRKVRRKQFFAFRRSDYGVMNRQLVVDAVYSTKYPLDPSNEDKVRKDGILGLIDLDYQHPSIIRVDDSKRLLKEGLEKMLGEKKKLNSDVLGKQVDELLQHIIDTSPNVDCDNLLFHQEDSTVAHVRRVCLATVNEVRSALNLAKSIGILRALCNEKQSQGKKNFYRYRLKFDKDDRDWIIHSINDAGELDKRTLFKEVLSNTKRNYKGLNIPDIPELEKEYALAEDRYKGLSSMELANGHDIACCLSVLCSGTDDLESDFESACINQTELESILDSGVVNSIRKWEAENPPYRVLPYDEEE